jgi:Na+/alanine symporter
MVQANSVSDSLRATFGVAPEITGLVLALITAVVILLSIGLLRTLTREFFSRPR